MNKFKYKTAASLIALSTAFAVMPAVVQGAGKEEKVILNIESQKLNQALNQLAQKFDLQIASFSEDLSGKLAKPLKGSFTDQEALKRLLEGSGLVFEYIDERTVSIRPKGKKTGSIHKINASGSLAMMQDAPKMSKGVAVPASSSNTSSISGHVSEISAGGNLEGALVRIIETGQTTKTDYLGNFRFFNVTPGNYTLSISYLGFASRVTDITLGRGEEFREEYSLGQTLGAIDEIVVFGSRSARAIALNLQRTAENNSEVVSADDLGNFTGTTISEALRRVPGIAFSRDDNTGEGQNIIIRGLAPDMNAVKINGLLLPVGSGQGRSANLNNILADSVERITIHKSLLPSHDSAGTGGLVEIETKSPLNRPHRYVNLSAEGSRTGKDFGNDLLVSGTVSGTFGSDENFGLSASVQYRKQKHQTIRYSTGLSFGQYLPLEADGSTSIEYMSRTDPRNPFPFEAGVEDVYPTTTGNTLSETDNDTLSITLSADWQVNDHTNFSLNIVNSESKQDNFRRGSFVILTSGYNKLIPIEALGGEVRHALNWDGFQAELNQTYISARTKNSTDTYSFRGQTSYDKWSFDYTLGYARGVQTIPESMLLNTAYGYNAAVLDSTFLLPEAVDAVEGRVISPFAKRTDNSLPLPLFTDAAFDFLNDPDNYGVGFASITENAGHNDRYTAKFSARYDFDQKYLKYLELGSSYEASESAGFGTGSFEQSYLSGYGHPRLSTLGLEFEESNLSSIGHTGRGFHLITRESIREFVDGLVVGDYTKPYAFYTTDPNPLLDDQFTKENDFAAYLQGRMDIGKLEIIGGVRLNHTKTRTANVISSTVRLSDGGRDTAHGREFAVLLDETEKATDFLPRFQFNYRENDNLVFRGSYSLSVARPRLQDLSGTKRYDLDLRTLFGPNNNMARLRVTEGNPDLKPSITHNFDFDVEYYHDQIGVIKVGVFYKHIKNLLESNVERESVIFDLTELPDDAHLAGEERDHFSGTLVDLIAANDIYIEAKRPENNEKIATVWGIETHVERQFTFLPGFWNGFGVYANYTYTKSSRHRTYKWSYSPIFDANGDLDGREAVELNFEGVPLGQQSAGSGTVALTYNKHNIDAALVYGFQERSLTEFRGRNLSDYNEGVGTLDFRISYYFNAGGGNYRVYFEGQDMLKGTNDPDLETTQGGVGGTAKYYTGGTYLGGRRLRLGLTASF